MREDGVRAMHKKWGRQNSSTFEHFLSVAKAIFLLFYVANHWEVSQTIKLFLDGAEPFSIRTYLLLQVLFCPTL